MAIFRRYAGVASAWSWWLIVLGVLLFLFPTPLTTVIGTILIIVSIGMWVAAWSSER